MKDPRRRSHSAKQTLSPSSKNTPFTEAFLKNEGGLDKASKLEIISKCLKNKKGLKGEESKRESDSEGREVKTSVHKHTEKNYNGGKTYIEMIESFVDRFAESPERLHNCVFSNQTENNKLDLGATYDGKLSHIKVENNQKKKEGTQESNQFRISDNTRKVIDPCKYEEKRLFDILPESLRNNKEFEEIRVEQDINLLLKRRKAAEKWVECNIPEASKTLEFQGR